MIGFHFERVHGLVTTGVLYVTCGLTGALLSTLAAPHSISVGASGAIMGLAGTVLFMLVARLVSNPDTVTRGEIFSGMFFGFFVMSNLVMGWGSSSIDNFAHLGGFTAGLLWGGHMYLALQKAHELPASSLTQSEMCYHVKQFFSLQNVPLMVLSALDIMMIALVYTVLKNDSSVY